MVDEKSQLWQYLSQGQQSLIREGYFLLEDLKNHTPLYPIKDYSFIVFPFAKAYEGFLKQLFLDLRFIKRWQYEDEHLRIGKILSPALQKMLRGRSAYRQLTELTGSTQAADNFWLMWKRGRNQVFHYFPHNLSAISLSQAEDIIMDFISVMDEGVQLLKKHKQPLSIPARPLYYGFANQTAV